jgi:hypothetical protein
MKAIVVSSLIGLGLIFAAPAFAAPIVPSSDVVAGQADDTIILARGHGGRGMGRGHGHGNRGLHLGWSRGRHLGWGRRRH